MANVRRETNEPSKHVISSKLLYRSIMILLPIYFCAVSFLLSPCRAEIEWSFIALADWHGGESFALDPGKDSIVWTKHLETIQYIKKNYGEDSLDLMILPGDTNNGKWDSEEFIKDLDESLQPKEAVLTAGRNCYSTIKDLFASGGFEPILLALGDHEIGGNSWKVGSSKTLALPQYRQGFVEGFNKDVNNNFLFPEYIGGVRSRPYDTMFKDTTYAYLHKNALFITIDAFQQVESDHPYLDRENGVGGEGIISGTVTGTHLAWFELILKEARNNESIKHIFVQSHLPVIQPVRKVACSGQFMDYGEESGFWKLMNKYGVDVYFAGEVHANTATKSENSDLVQVVSRGNMFNNFLKIQVSDEKIDIISYNEVGEKPRWNNNYVEHGHLIIDKSSSTTKLSSSGALKLLNRNEPLVHLTFEGSVQLRERQVLGMIHDDFGDKLVGDQINMGGVTCTNSMPNEGSFGQQFDAQMANIDFVLGKVGQSAGSFNESSRLGIFGTGPNAAGNIVSFSVWINTSNSYSEMILVHYGSVFGSNASSKDFFTLTLNNGKPKIYTQTQRFITSTDDINIADGSWHHVGVSMPRKSCLLSEVEVYVDGKMISTDGPEIDKHIFTTTSGRMSFGSFGYSSNVYDSTFPAMKTYQGLMDDIKVWSRPLTTSDFPSFKKIFHVSNGFQCNRKGIQKVQIRAKLKRCKTRCRKMSRCFGFEFRVLPAGKPKCLLLKGVPTLGPARPKTKCAIAV